MPRMSGDEAFAAMRKVQPDLKIIISSGYSKESAASALLNAGAKTFVQKPFRSSELLKIIRKVLDS